MCRKACKISSRRGYGTRGPGTRARGRHGLGSRRHAGRSGCRRPGGDAVGTLATAFAGRKAVSNRRAFRDRRAPLAAAARDVDVAAHTPKHLAMLANLVSSCHAPNLRLELLQFVLGFDDAKTWTRDRLLGALELAQQAVDEQHAASGDAP